MVLQRTTLYILLSFLILSNCIAQKQTKLHAVYSYNNFDLNDVMKIDLVVNGVEAISKFTDLKFKKDTTFIDEYEAISFTRKGGDSLGRMYYSNSLKKLLIFRDFVSISNVNKPVIVEENIPDFNWQLKDEVKKINKFNCNLATLSFRGRNYIVWYTMDIPTTFGPWKFSGLPGLIVEAKTDDNKVVFSLNEVKNVENIAIEIPSKGDKITFKQYVDYKKNTIPEFIKSLKAKLPRGSVINFTSGNKNLEKSFE